MAIALAINLAMLAVAVAGWLAFDSVALLETYRARDALRGKELAWDGGRGVGAGVDGAGRLVVQLPGGGRTALDAGEVHLLR